MIISKIMGGLGNQMFQYATGRAFALKTNQTYFLDTTFYDQHFHRIFQLNSYKIQENILPLADAERFKRYQNRWFITGYLDRLKTKQHRTYRLEAPVDYYRFDKKYVSLSNNQNIYLDGYWQNEKYFRDIRDLLLGEFELKQSIAVSQPDLYNRVSAANSISIHIRRTDYIDRFYGTLPLTYYINCISDLRNRITFEPKIYVFGDDPGWIKSNFNIGLPFSFVSTEFTLNDCQEMEAMSLCRYNIIANSSFSWWAAWLNKHPEKIVYAPNIWLVNEPNKYDTSDAVPKSWQKIGW